MAETLMLQHQPARPDIYIGLVAAAGTDLSEVKAQLKAQLAVVGYVTEELKVSSLIAQLTGINPSSDEYDRIKCLMDAGDHCRRSSPQGDGVAATVIAEIRRLREARAASDSNSIAYVIDSFKNPAEIELFDLVYSRNYYTLSVYLEKNARIENLQIKIARSKHQPPEDIHKLQAEKIVDLDEKGSGKQSQNVRDTFPKADYFVEGRSNISAQIERFVSLIFARPFIAPTPGEYGMSIARIAGLRSADLSRQVGAAIFDCDRRIISTGCNEVPYPGGGIYMFPNSGIGDNRDHTHQIDPNFIEIQRSLIELVKVLQGADLLDSERDASALADSLLVGQHKELMANARVRNLIEFGRIVHAEMHAICEAAAGGRATQGATLFCTTFPCHGCARHVIAAGLAEVVYIEPYPKSMAIQLYGGEIEFRHEGGEAVAKAYEKVIFRPFHGVAPTLYQRVFRHQALKDDRGTIPQWEPLAAVPVGSVHSVERPALELAASKSVADILEKVRVAKSESGEISDGQ